MIQSNLCTTAILGKWQGDRYMQDDCYIQGDHYIQGRYNLYRFACIMNVILENKYTLVYTIIILFHS